MTGEPGDQREAPSGGPEESPPTGAGEGLSEADIRWGLIYTHDRANQNTSTLQEVTATIEGLVELLVQRGLLSAEEVEAAKERAAEDVRRRFKEAGMAVITQEHGRESKYSFTGGAAVDCENRIHLCKAACCRFRVGLSSEDIREGILKWDTAQPYTLAKKANGSCVHLDDGTCGCTVYAERPIPCRGYSCKDDKRIWLDFERRIPQPLLHHPDWPECLDPDDRRPGGADAATASQ
jgi:putative zinc- or iron-chelating protein